MTEDEPALVDLSERWLAVWSRLRTVSDGAAAIEAFDTSVDVALLDRQMPIYFNDKVLDCIRGISSTCPVGMVTATTPELALIALWWMPFLL